MLFPFVLPASIAVLVLSNAVTAGSIHEKRNSIVAGYGGIPEVQVTTTVAVYDTVTVGYTEASTSAAVLQKAPNPGKPFSLSSAAPSGFPPLPSALNVTGSSAWNSSFNGSYPLNTTTGSPLLKHGSPQPTVAPNATTLPTSSNFTSATEVTNTTESLDASSGFLYGVNVGGWLILEKWMNGDTFVGDFANAWDQYSFDSIDGAADALANHWKYFFTEDDVKELASHGINALRIPIGFWAYDNANTPYVKGADAYMEKAIGWARTYNMKVWVDCHGSPGSQNGYDNSGHSGNVEWQQYGNLDRSISVLKTMAAKYGASSYSDVVVGLELTNEPLAGGNNDFATTQSWSVEAYKAVRAAAANKNLIIVMHDAFQGPAVWESTVASANANKKFGIDTHMYQLYSDADNALNQAEHITKACGWASELSVVNDKFPVYAGEWSPMSNICVDTNGYTIAGSTCTSDGCQCQNVDLQYWNAPMIKEVRKFVEAQMDAFQASTSGYFMWAAKGPGAWGFLNGVSAGVIPSPVTARKYPGQCGDLTKRAPVIGERRTARGMMGVEGEKW